ncbi:ATP-binding protein [Streptomyces sp. NPDC051917]|uniref:ATP-binding protein n=1 Tax=Streptomyces sp. NPDC051917 TaxID=3154754 RepID=UPI003453509C
MTYLKRSFASEPQSIAQVRDFVDLVIGSRVDQARAADIRCCVSEMASNAMLHARTDDTTFTVKVCIDRQGCVRIEVYDGDQDATRDVVVTAAADESPNGRGILIVQALSDDWGVDKQGHGKVVWSHFAGTQASSSHNACSTVLAGS